MEIMHLFLLIVPGMLVYFIIRNISRKVKKRQIWKKIPSLMEGDFRLVATSILRGKAAAVKKTKTGFDIHDFHWSLPSLLQARFGEELGTIILIDSDTVPSTISYKENAIFLPDKRKIEVRNVRWKVTLFDVIDKTKSELGVFLGEPPKQVEISNDSDLPMPWTGEDPRQEVLKRLQQLTRQSVIPG